MKRKALLVLVVLLATLTLAAPALAAPPAEGPYTGYGAIYQKGISDGKISATAPACGLVLCNYNVPRPGTNLTDEAYNRGFNVGFYTARGGSGVNPVYQAESEARVALMDSGIK